MNYPIYLNFDHVPARIPTIDSVPEVYRGDGKWVPYADRFALVTEAVHVSKEELDVLIKACDASVGSTES